MTVLTVLKAPDERLTAVCEAVVPGAPELLHLGEDMVLTMFYAAGKGLAAPQVGILRRVICMRYQGGVVVMCNPVIARHGKDVVTDVEGCLSLPFKRVRVPRYRIVDVTWYDVYGNAQSATMRNDDARCVQHEIDHLNGVLITERAAT